MNNNTAYYNANAQAFFDATSNIVMTPLYKDFLPLIAKAGHILDAGCGSGRDAKHFKSEGFQVTAMDASPELVKRAEIYLGQKVELKQFQQIDWQGRFDGIWCCASLLHVPAEELNLVFAKLAQALKSGGVLYASFKYGKGERQIDGRTFTDMNERSIKLLLDNTPALRPNKLGVTSDQRPERSDEKWLNLLATKAV